MKRFFVKIQYKGTEFSGWQSQPNANTIQDEIESQLEKVLRKSTAIVGCGRTDAGVHASDYVFHFDGDVEDTDTLTFKLNRMLPHSISILKMVEVKSDAHARFDAEKRSYEYHIHKYKNPFNYELSYHHPKLFQADLDLLNQTASSFLMYRDFNTFCKSNTDVKTKLCQLVRSEWEINEISMTFHVTADRFLRGMVRLMVGCCVNVALGKIELSDVKIALEAKERLEMDLSVPASGLFLSRIEYPSTVLAQKS
ncbi:tRNA pseudouridine(38-40) synthase TruA [Portibacter marinus]|uniref:tRNA pseudouridine(38-40) synthase TruA n=1 Tax=Portibacter marinus TaxID=2898660 RepID=UPI001F167E9C|nr:tRNA pseudouridine(38-40) synthase TruA [Portibacter marinus]